MNSFVAKVHAVQSDFDIHQPWVINHSDSVICGTVFFANGHDIGLPQHHVVGITNAHCVESSASRECRVMKDTVVLGQCTVAWISPTQELDFAILIPKFDYCGALATVSENALPTGTQVRIIGYPYNSDTCQHAYGSVSGHADGHWMQCNIASNIGNSGGPLVSMDTGAVHGIVTQSPIGSESITEVTPMWAVAQTLRRWSVPHVPVLRVPSLDICITRLHDLMKKQLGLCPDAEGGLVQRANCGRLAVGDVIVRVGSFPVCKHTCMVQTPRAGAVAIDSEALSLQLPMRFTVVLHRKGVAGEFEMVIHQQEEEVLHIRELYPFWEHVEYVQTSGAVFMNLNLNLLKEIDETEKEDELVHSAWHRWSSRNSRTAGVVVSFVMPHTYAHDFGLKPLMCLQSVNDTPIKNIEQLKQYLSKKGRLRCASMMFTFDDFCLAVPLSSIQF